MTKFSCGHSPDRTVSVKGESEKIDVNVCNGCYDDHKENFEKFHFEVIAQWPSAPTAMNHLNQLTGTSAIVDVSWRKNNGNRW